MTGPGEGFSETVRKFSDDVDAAVGRARRARAEAAERAASFQQDNRKLAEQARAGQLRVRREELTAEELRRAAVGFRVERGLPVEEFPDASELVTQEREPERRRGVARPAPDDDDEDFSQERIMTRN